MSTPAEALQEAFNQITNRDQSRRAIIYVASAAGKLLMESAVPKDTETGWLVRRIDGMPAQGRGGQIGLGRSDLLIEPNAPQYGADRLLVLRRAVFLEDSNAIDPASAIRRTITATQISGWDANVDAGFTLAPTDPSLLYMSSKLVEQLCQFGARYEPLGMYTAMRQAIQQSFAVAG